MKNPKKVARSIRPSIIEDDTPLFKLLWAYVRETASNLRSNG